jgi:hypothetical protein
MLSFHLDLDLPSGLVSSGFSTKILYTPLLFSIRATGPTHLILLDFITRTIMGEEYWPLAFVQKHYLEKRFSTDYKT